ncbi:hypothetical protein C8Q74DRAFT_499159 [Fomes fomentarius]|nr:hypothetical protein C8Q74DRAFT_499159 [Fomes fomentarius]
MAQGHVAAFGAIVSGLGVVSGGYLLFVYGTADAKRFQAWAKDRRGTYLYFCLACRVPALCVLASSTALVVYFLAVWWTMSPTAVLILCVLAGMLVASPILVWLLMTLVEGTRMGLRKLGELIERSRTQGEERRCKPGGEGSSANPQVEFDDSGRGGSSIPV